MKKYWIVQYKEDEEWIDIMNENEDTWISSMDKAYSHYKDVKNEDCYSDVSVRLIEVTRKIIRIRAGV